MSGKKPSPSDTVPLSSLQPMFDSLGSKLEHKLDDIRNEFSSVSGRVQACEADLASVKADTGLTDPLFLANQTNILALTHRLTVERYNNLSYSEQPERVENARFRVLRSATTGTGTLPTDTSALSQFLCCDPSIITHVTAMHPNGLGKARILIHFKEAAAAAAATAAFRGSTNRTRAVLDVKRTRMQSARVGLAIQLQRVAREDGHPQATFRAEDRAGWDFIVYRESPTATPMAYPFIHHFPAGEPPAQGSPFISVNKTTVTELLNRLSPLHSFPKPPVKPPVNRAPPPQQNHPPSQTTNNRPHSPNRAHSTHHTNFQRPPTAPPRDLPASTSRAAGLQQPQSRPASRSTTPRKGPSPFQNQHKRQAVSDSPPNLNARPSASSSPTRRSPSHNNPNPNPSNPNHNNIPPPPPPLNHEQTCHSLTDQM